MQTFAQKLGLQVYRARRAKRLTQEALAEHLGLSQSQVSAVERGRENALAMERIIRLASFLSIDLDAIERDTGGPDSHRAYCPSSRCPSNRMYFVNEEPFILPGIDTSGARYCRLCGHKLQTVCPHCHRAIQHGSCCTECGCKYISTESLEAHWDEVSDDAFAERLNRRNSATCAMSVQQSNGTPAFIGKEGEMAPDQPMGN
ncbi:MAG: XRE family transcriptional regulator [Planctomycetes bacterium]|nr:XRE family transcriptional regulator [Planctomycetota bacterium]NOG55839.1 helix-turn-helix transcriptional regulator [Planctomycetota bacterium]